MKPTDKDRIENAIRHIVRGIAVNELKNQIPKTTDKAWDIESEAEQKGYTCNVTDKDRIENAIRHIQTATDVDPWAMEIAVDALKKQIPVKPTETTDKAWGIAVKQAVCPVCDYYLPHVGFLGDYKGMRITYCDTCGQAINWEGWEFDE